MRAEVIWVPLVVLAILGIYLPGLGNPLVFDDALLGSGQVFSEYGSLMQLKPRLLSYGTFVWVQDVFGEGWWKQRVFNLVIHIAVVLGLIGLYQEILRHIVSSSTEGVEPAAGALHRSPALALAIGFFALNPVAVYAVAYLVQRSILMATLFVVVSLWLFARGLREKNWLLLGLALIAYVLAVMSKEHAVLAPLAAIPLFVLVKRPSPRSLAIMATVGAALVAAVGAALYLRYGEIIGKPFDQYSRVYLAQLSALGPDVEKNAYLLSIINQAYFFLKYGVLWLIPNADWMSIDLRPPFPVSVLSIPQAIGAVAYLGVIAAGFYFLLRHRDWRALVSVSILIPALLFASEFATVWVQDPFVLYRSYLWAIGVPGLVFILFQGLSARSLAVVGVVIGALLGWQAIDRVFSLSTPNTVWTDAINKLSDDPRAVGRWFPYLNRAQLHLDNENMNEAYRDFMASNALGDGGLGQYNIGAMLGMVGKYEESLTTLSRAEQMGYREFNLHYQRGVAQASLGQLPEAYGNFKVALAGAPAKAVKAAICGAMGLVSERMNNPAQAIRDYRKALSLDPASPRHEEWQSRISELGRQVSP